MLAHTLVRALLVALVFLGGLVDPVHGRPRRTPASAAQKPPKKNAAATSSSVDPLALGLQAMAGSDWPAATKQFEAGYRSSRRPEFLYQLARVAQATQQPIVAQDLFRRYLADPARLPDEEASKLAEAALTQRLAATGSVVVVADPGALVLVDDRVSGTLPLPLPLLLSAATHTIVVEYPNGKLSSPVLVPAERTSELRFSRSSGAVASLVLPAILLFSDVAGLSVGEQQALSDVVAQAAIAEQQSVVQPAAVLPRAPELETCLNTDRCRRQLAQRSEIPFFATLRAQVQGVAPVQSWAVQLRLTQAQIGPDAATAEVRCEGCTKEAAMAKLKAATGTMLSEGLTRPSGQLHLVVMPTSAQVRIGKTDPRPGPVEEPLWTGSYEIEVFQPGYQKQVHTVTIADGQKADLNVVLLQEAAPPPAGDVPTTRGKRPVWRLALGGALVGVGLAGVGVGIGNLAINNTCIGPQEGINCPDLYDTGAPGAGLLAAGAALLIPGIIILALPGAPARRR